MSLHYCHLHKLIRKYQLHTHSCSDFYSFRTTCQSDTFMVKCFLIFLQNKRGVISYLICTVYDKHSWENICSSCIVVWPVNSVPVCFYRLYKQASHYILILCWHCSYISHWSVWIQRMLRFQSELLNNTWKCLSYLPVPWDWLGVHAHTHTNTHTNTHTHAHIHTHTHKLIKQFQID